MSIILLLISFQDIINKDSNKIFINCCICNLSEFLIRMNIFCTCNPNNNLFDGFDFANILNIEGFDLAEYFKGASNWGIQINFSCNFFPGCPIGVGLSLGLGMTCSPINIDTGAVDWENGLYQFGDSNSVAPSFGVSSSGGGSQKTGDD